MLRSFQNRVQRSGSFLKAHVLDVTTCMITTNNGDREDEGPKGQ